MCYAGSYELCQNCPICDSPRLDAKGKAKKVMPYLSIKERLKIQYNDKSRAKELLYRHEYITNKNDKTIKFTLIFWMKKVSNKICIGVKLFPTLIKNANTFFFKI